MSGIRWLWRPDTQPRESTPDEEECYGGVSENFCGMNPVDGTRRDGLQIRCTWRKGHGGTIHASTRGDGAFITAMWDEQSAPIWEIVED